MMVSKPMRMGLQSDQWNCEQYRISLPFTLPIRVPSFLFDIYVSYVVKHAVACSATLYRWHVWVVKPLVPSALIALEAKQSHIFFLPEKCKQPVRIIIPQWTCVLTDSINLFEILPSTPCICGIEIENCHMQK